MKCLEREWWVYFWVAFVCFWIYVVGIPVVLLIVLWKRKYSPAGKFNKKNDKRLISNTKGLGWLVCKCVPKRIASYFEPDPEHDLDHIHTKRQFGPLYLNFEPEYWYWEAVELARRFLMTAGLVLVKPGSNIQLLLGLSISAFYLVAFQHAKPMVEDDDDTLQIVVSLQIILTMHVVILQRNFVD